MMAQQPITGIVERTSVEPIVMPALDTNTLVDRFNTIQQLKIQLLEKGDANTGDIMEIVGKRYIKKSGWRKLAFAFNLTISIEKEWKEQWKSADEKGNEVFETTYYFHVRVTAPNGRYVVGVACASTDERDFAHAEHDPYALAYTRATNRAISDILGLGEVSYEEMQQQTHERRRRSTYNTPESTPTSKSSASVIVQDAKWVTPPKNENVATASPKAEVQGQEELPSEEELREMGIEQPEALQNLPFKTVRMVKALQPITGDDGRQYGPFKAEDVVAIPEPTAMKLVDRGYAVDIATGTPAGTPQTKEERTPEPPAKPKVHNITSKDGTTTWGSGWMTADGAQIQFDQPIDFRKNSIQGVYNFLTNRALGEMIATVESEGGKLGYDLVGTESDGGVVGVILRGNITEDQLISLLRRMEWVCRTAQSKNRSIP